MTDISLLTTAVTHQLFAIARSATGMRCEPDASQLERDRGAVSLEQVLWFVAAGVSVAVIAGLLWAQIKDKADDPVNAPVAP